MILKVALLWPGYIRRGGVYSKLATGPWTYFLGEKKAPAGAPLVIIIVIVIVIIVVVVVAVAVAFVGAVVIVVDDDAVTFIMQS